jgi:sortase A
MTEDKYETMWKKAEEYNETISSEADRFTPTEEMDELYNQCLDVDGTGLMGYIEIPSIRVQLPIYHGIENKVLDVAVGHIEGSSLPVGGTGTHCVLSGHRGLPSARLFTDIDQLVVGDTFMLHILGETLTYEVDQILIVEPDQTEALGLDPDEDYCTLVTCTPYGINTHRLLVRGHRIPNISDGSRITADAFQIDTLIVAPVIAVPVLLILFILLMTRTSKKRRKKAKEDLLEEYQEVQK